MSIFCFDIKNNFHKSRKFLSYLITNGKNIMIMIFSLRGQKRIRNNLRDRHVWQWKITKNDNRNKRAVEEWRKRKMEFEENSQMMKLLYVSMNKTIKFNFFDFSAGRCRLVSVCDAHSRFNERNIWENNSKCAIPFSYYRWKCNHLSC